VNTNDWRHYAACLNEDSELFFPKGAEGPWLLVIEEAKAVCRTCPVVDSCLTFALDESISDGIFGGLTHTERDGLRRSVRRGRTAAQNIAAKAEEARQPRRERTMQTVLEDNTVRLFVGHLGWTGGANPIVNAIRYTPRRLAFIADRGRTPEGQVLVDCGTTDCILPAHLTDQQERGYCGTRSGYQKHQEDGTGTCPPCRKANADADGRLRRNSELAA
jgi:hypothetical protein